MSTGDGPDDGQTSPAPLAVTGSKNATHRRARHRLLVCVSVDAYGKTPLTHLTMQRVQTMA